MRIQKEVPVTCTKTVTTLKCDLCKKDVTNENNTYNSCPSEQALMSIFIGYNTLQYGGYSSYPHGSKYGVEDIELCKKCRDDWFKDILKQFPNARMVKIND